MEFQDVIYSKKDGVAKITINRPHVLNAIRAKTLSEMAQAFEDAGKDKSIGVVVLTGAGERAFSSGGDLTDPDRPGYIEEMTANLQRVHGLIRSTPKPVIAMVNGYAIGGGHVLHLICDLSIASETAKFGQIGPSHGAFDAGFGPIYLARVVGEKKAREIWFLCRQYSAQDALQMGLVNKVVPSNKLEEEVDLWCKEILSNSPTAIRFLKSSFNSDTDHVLGIEDLAMGAVRLFFTSDEAKEAHVAFKEKRKPDFSKFR